MELDVIIPVRNGAPYILKALNSVVGQIGVGRIIVVDDDSTDNSREIVIKYAQVHDCVQLVVASAHIGLSAARNLGVTHSKAEWVAFLDVDDFWENGKIQAQLKHLEKHSNCIANFVGAKNHLKSNGKVTWQSENLKLEGDFKSLMLGQFRITGSASSVIIRKDLLLKLGGFDESLKFGEDFDLWLKLSRVQNICQVEGYFTNILIRDDSMQRLVLQNKELFRNSEIHLHLMARYLDEFDEKEIKQVIYSKIWLAIRSSRCRFFDLVKFERQILTEEKMLFSRANLHNFAALSLLALWWRFKVSFGGDNER